MSYEFGLQVPKRGTPAMLKHIFFLGDEVTATPPPYPAPGGAISGATRPTIVGFGCSNSERLLTRSLCGRRGLDRVIPHKIDCIIDGTCPSALLSSGFRSIH